MKNPKIRFLCEAAMMIAVATVLSMLKIDLPLGGGLTICSMLPIVVIAYRYGTVKGIATAFVYSVIQLLLGIDNVSYATSAVMAIGIIALDYIVAYTLIGFAGIFKGKIKNLRLSVSLGIIVTFAGRFVCHFITGVWIWEALWPNELGMTSVVYSFCYNGWYMGLEAVITVIAALALCIPFSKYLENKQQ